MYQIHNNTLLIVLTLYNCTATEGCIQVRVSLLVQLKSRNKTRLLCLLSEAL